MELCLVTDHACNLRCSYCYSGAKASRSMSPLTAERAIELALTRDPTGLALSFFGGEPLLAMDLIEHATDYAARRLEARCPGATPVVFLNTNATLVSERTERFIRRYRDVTAFVSLDGPASVHDRHRVDVAGRGSFEATRLGLLRMARAGASVVPLAVVNPDTASALGASAAELFSLPVARAHVTCNLRAAWDDAALRGLREGLRAAAQVWAQAFRAGRRILFEPFTTKILSHLHAAMPCASRCQLGAHELVVAPSGQIYPCGELVGDDNDDRHVIGNLDDGVWIDKLQALRANKERVELTCRDCGLRERCSSSCGCKHVALTGQFGIITDTLCEIESAFIEAADALAAELYAEGCAAFIDYFYRQPWRANGTTELIQLRRSAAASHGSQPD